MRCVQKRAAKERAEYIQKNRQEVDPFAELTDPVDLIIALHTPRSRDPLIAYKPCISSAEELYGELTTDQAKRLEQVAIAEKRSGDESLADDIATGLAVLTLFPISDLQSTCVKLGHFRPAVLFRGASSSVRDDLVELLDNTAEPEVQTLEVNQALCALAWIGDEVVARTFALWEAEPPAWRKSLYVGPGSYAHTAGWELRGAFRRNLYFETCFSVQPADVTASSCNSWMAVSKSCNCSGVNRVPRSARNRANSAAEAALTMISALAASTMACRR